MSSTKSPCYDGQVQCGDGTCVDRRRKCDGTRDCGDGADEADCLIFASTRDNGPTASLVDSQHVSLQNVTIQGSFLRGPPTTYGLNFSTPYQQQFADYGIFAENLQTATSSVSSSSSHRNTSATSYSAEALLQGNFSLPTAQLSAGGSSVSGKFLQQQHDSPRHEMHVESVRTHNRTVQTQAEDERRGDGGSVRICGDNQFSCRNGSCLDRSGHCNGTRECSDGSDEQNCPPPSIHDSLVKEDLSGTGMSTTFFLLFSVCLNGRVRHTNMYNRAKIGEPTLPHIFLPSR